jgi:hypothetical protein
VNSSKVLVVNQSDDLSSGVHKGQRNEDSSFCPIDTINYHHEMLKPGLPLSCLPQPILIAFYSPHVVPPHWLALIEEARSLTGDGFKVINYRPNDRPIFEEARCIWRWVIPAPVGMNPRTKGTIRYLMKVKVDRTSVMVVPVLNSDNQCHRYQRRTFRAFGCSTASPLTPSMTNVRSIAGQAFIRGFP